jgi:hypothetical protein
MEKHKKNALTMDDLVEAAAKAAMASKNDLLSV